MTSTQLLIYSILQWGLFLGLGFHIFSWMDRKPKRMYPALGAYIIAALFSGYFLSTGLLSEGIENGRKLIAVCNMSAIVGILATVSLVLQLKNRKTKVINYVLAAFALIVFLLITQAPESGKDKEQTKVESEA